MRWRHHPARNNREFARTGTSAMNTLSPARIMDVGLGFWSSKVLLSAIELGLFTALGAKSLTGRELQATLGLHPRADPDFFDALVALRFLERDGDGPEARYRNSDETGLFLDRNSPQFMAGFLEMANARLYRFWGDLSDGLRTGGAQNEIKHTGAPMFAELYSKPERLEQFMDAMSGISAANFQALAEKFDFSRYRTVCDVGGATGQLSMLVAKQHPHLRCTSADLPAATAIAERKIAAAGLADRVTAKSIDFFADPLPKADVITMGMILHDWNLEKKMQLIRAAYDALPPAGAFIAVENIIDDARRENAFGLMMSLNMLIEFGDAFDFTGADFSRWCREVGFSRTEVMPLAGPASAGVAYK
jgi:2-polyprenyl-3-methyl-5-hydroxy-6-metoxy-1,4-benzoquinol methylase